MPRKFLLLCSVCLSLALVSACQSVDSDGPIVAPSAKPVNDPTLDATLRKAAADAEASYNYSEAAQHYATLLQKTPNDPDLILATARNLRYSGAPQKSIEVVNRLIATVGPQEPLLIELGKDYLAADQLNLAASVLTQARSTDPSSWQILSALAVVQDYQGNYKDAQETYEAGLKIAPNNPTLLNNYALSLAQSGQLDSAITALQNAIGQPNASAQTRQNLALMLALKGDKEGASRLIRSDLPPDMAENNISYYQGMDSQ